MSSRRRPLKIRDQESPGARTPGRAEIAAAYGGTLEDLVVPGLRVLFCGINPGLYSAAVGHHFARPGNRFWPALHAAGLTERVLKPSEERSLLSRGYGITNIVDRATARADELNSDELVAGSQGLVAKVNQHRPLVLAVLGVTAYRTAFRRPHAKVGQQAETIGDTVIWVLPSPSGLNVSFSLAPFHALARLVADLRGCDDVALPRSPLQGSP
jgi:double-stranded uracil-DNA glycosylase